MKTISVIYILFLLSGFCYSQNFHIIEINNKNSFYSNESLDTTSLPFWDDFSKSNDINNLKWSKYENIRVKDYSNNNAPSINIIEFDGLNKDGNPYFHNHGYGVCD